MSRNILNIETYTPTQNDRLFFDADIWLYLFSPIGNYKRDIIKKYDGFLKNTIEANASIFISSLILSEFFNAYARKEFNILKNKYPQKYKNFKTDFRGTKEYSALMTEIKSIVKTKILKISKRIDDGFGSIDLEKVFTDIDKADFNDKYYQELLQGKNIKIVTNDYDFAETSKDIAVITANHRALRSR